MHRQLPNAVHTAAACIVLAVAALESGCPGSLDPSLFETTAGSQVESGDASAMCANVPEAILATTCGTAGCHAAANPQAGLDLASPGVAARLVGKPASQGGLLVDPSSPSTSVLYEKLSASPPFGAQMPFGQKPLDATTTACVLRWIETLGPDVADADSVGGDSNLSPAPGNTAAGDTADATIDSAASSSWNPASLPGTVLWLDASENVATNGPTVTRWGDRSGLHNDAAPTAASTSPTLVAGAIHGLPALHFDQTVGAFVSIVDSASLQWGTDGFVVAIVAADRKPTAGLGHGGGLSTVFAKPHPSGGATEITLHLNFFTSENADDDSTFHFGMGEGYPGLVSTTDGYNDSRPRLYVARRSAAAGAMTLDLRVNGMTVGTTQASPIVDVTLAGSPVRIGSTYGQNVNGDVSEVVAVHGNVIDQDLIRLENYLLAKYELSE